MVRFLFCSLLCHDHATDFDTVLSEELENSMRLLGVTALDQLRPEMVNASRLLNEMWRPERPARDSRL